jgi:hypothetical protein
MASVESGAQDKPENGAPTLQALEDSHSAQRAAARKPLREATESYRTKLEEYGKSSQVAGNLKAVLAAKQAIDDQDAGRPVTPSGDVELTKIQSAYAVELRKADAACAKAVAKVDRDQIESLKKLVASLTKDGRIEQAVSAQNKLDQLIVSLGEADSAVTVATGPSDIEEWKQRALSEFPDLGNPNSKLSLRVKELRDAKASIRGYFSNPQWPYLLTTEASLSLKPKAPSPTVAPSSEVAPVVFLAVEAELEGKAQKSNQYQAVLNWFGEAKLSWKVTGTVPGTYDIIAIYASKGGGEFKVTAGKSEFLAKVEPTGGWRNHQERLVGQLSIESGNFMLSIQGDPKEFGALMDLRSLELRPSAP